MFDLTSTLRMESFSSILTTWNKVISASCRLLFQYSRGTHNILRLLGSFSYMNKDFQFYNSKCLLISYLYIWFCRLYQLVRWNIKIVRNIRREWNTIIVIVAINYDLLFFLRCHVLNLTLGNKRSHPIYHNSYLSYEIIKREISYLLSFTYRVS